MQSSTLINSIWVWLATQGLTERVIPIDGKPHKVGMSRQRVEVAVRSFIPSIVERIVLAYDWDFLFAKSSFTTTGTSEYALKGENDDCNKIISVQYGTGRGRALRWLNPHATARREGGDASDGGDLDSGTVYGYTLVGESNDGFPFIQLYDTPGTGDTVQYWYRRQGLTLESFDEEFSWVIEDFCKAKFATEFLTVAENSLNELIDNYKPGGEAIDRARIEPAIEAGNIRRAGLNSGC